jgi:2-aminoadipate transaminase
MIDSAERFLSHAGRTMKRSSIREILKVLQKPGMISFAGGLPAPETFPVDDLKDIVKEILEEHGPDALQYGTTEGDPDLRRMLVLRHQKQGLRINTENLIITTGSQQGIDLISRVFINQGDYVLCGLPSYLGAINTFISYGAKLKGITLDESGIRTDELEETVARLKEYGKKLKFLYVVPDFQNPSGITVPESRRSQLINIAEKHDLLIIEDSPYREIRFEGQPQRTMYELDTTGRVLTLFTFSKIFAPGFRVAWMIGNPVLLDKIIMAKQTSDLCTSPFAQKIIARYIEKNLLENNIQKTIELYRRRRDQMIKCFRDYMPEGVSWTEPSGGLFLFVTLPEGLMADNIFERAIERNVAFVSGSTFFCNNSGTNTMRLNFSFMDENHIEEGVKRLAEIIRAEKVS